MATDPSFQMTVEDVFQIRGRGTVVTGRVESGVLRVGDEVTIRGQGGDRKAVVLGLEMFRRQIQEANVGDNIGVLFRDGGRSDVRAGDKLVG